MKHLLLAPILWYYGRPGKTHFSHETKVAKLVSLSCCCRVDDLQEGMVEVSLEGIAAKGSFKV